MFCSLLQFAFLEPGITLPAVELFSLPVIQNSMELFSGIVAYCLCVACSHLVGKCTSCLFFVSGVRVPISLTPKSRDVVVIVGTFWLSLRVTNPQSRFYWAHNTYPTGL